MTNPRSGLCIGVIADKPRYATTDNVKLAQELDPVLCAQRCPSFAKLQQFVMAL